MPAGDGGTSMADHGGPRRDSALDNELGAGLDCRFGLTANGTTVSIATGIGPGFITYALCKLRAGWLAEAKPKVQALAALFARTFAVSN